MKRFALLAALLLSTPALAQQATPSGPPFSVELTAEEGSAVMNLLDQVIKSGGYASAKQVVPIMDKMVDASRKAKAVADLAAKNA
jgi:hypothetical protein